jgi:hypothetical protein
VPCPLSFSTTLPHLLCFNSVSNPRFLSPPALVLGILLTLGCAYPHTFVVEDDKTCPATQDTFRKYKMVGQSDHAFIKFLCLYIKSIKVHHLLTTHCLPGTLWKTHGHILSHFIFTTTLWGGLYVNAPCKDEETEAHRSFWIAYRRVKTPKSLSWVTCSTSFLMKSM